jgi:hypothetical protein
MTAINRTTTKSPTHPQLHEQISINQIYLYGLIILIGVISIWNGIRHVKSRSFVAWLRRNLIIRTVCKRPLGSSSISYLAAICIALLLAANILALRLHINGMSALAQRASQLSLASLLVLILSTSGYAAVDSFFHYFFNIYFLNLSLINLGMFHRWIGRVCLLQAGIHAGCQTILLKGHLTPSHIAVRHRI